ncbi:MAG: hypothetical protein ACI9LX_003280, partial [Paraglaciecola sp.]
SILVIATSPISFKYQEIKMHTQFMFRSQCAGHFLELSAFTP